VAESKFGVRGCPLISSISKVFCCVARRVSSNLVPLLNTLADLQGSGSDFLRRYRKISILKTKRIATVTTKLYPNPANASVT
jgi:hypothetical protein